MSDDDHELTQSDVQQHYAAVADAVAPLAKVAGNETLLNAHRRYWYVNESNDDPSEAAAEGGYAELRRGQSLARDYDQLVETTLSYSGDDELRRSVYATTSYNRPQVFDEWEPKRWNDETETTEYLSGENPLPEWDDKAAFSVWADIDLTDELKTERQNLEDETQATVEAVLAGLIDKWAELYGGRDAVQLLDSVGGAYPMGAPSATLPIASHYKDDDDARARVFKEFVDRSQAWVKDVVSDVLDDVDGAHDVIDPDHVNNLNRAYKLPLSIHSTHDAVVTPIDTDDVTYGDPVGIDAVDDELRAEVREWCTELTSAEHRDAVDSLVATLWPDEYADADSWAGALDEWVEAEREREREQAEQRRAALRHRDSSRPADTDAPITTSYYDVVDALDALDAQAVARDTIVSSWNDGVSVSAGNRAFTPTWADPDCNGRANIVDSDQWTDTGESGHSGGPVKMVLIDEEGFPRGQTPTGEKWGDGVEYLRQRGYEIPVRVPDATTDDYDQTPHWALTKAAVALDVLDSDDLVEHGVGDDGSYIGFPDIETYNDTLDALDDVGVDHGREQSVSGEQADEQPDPDPDADMDGADVSDRWLHVRTLYETDESDNAHKQHARQRAAEALEAETAWMHVTETGKLWAYDDDSGQYDVDGVGIANETLEDKLGVFSDTPEKNEIINRLQHRNRVKKETLNAADTERKLVCVGNGVVDVEERTLLDHDPAYRFTRGVDHDWNPDAVPERMLRFLRGVTKRDVDMWTLIQQLGNGLLPGYPFKAFMIMYGPGDNGKSQVGKLFRKLVGDENAAAVELADMQGDDYATGDLPGKMINIGDDLSGKKVDDISLLKRSTGDAAIRANEKWEKTFMFENEAAMFFSGNEPPVFSEQTPAVKTRLYPIHMPHRFTTVDDDHKDATPNIAGKIASDDEEMSGLLTLAIDGARQLLDTGVFAMPEGPEERMRMYQAASDPITRFTMDCLDQGDSDDRVLKDDVYDVYANMCRHDNEQSTGDKVFKSEISQQAEIDVESAQTRALTDGSNSQTCWRYLRFSPHARTHMPARLEARYFDDDADDAEPAGESADSDGGTDTDTDTETNGGSISDADDTGELEALDKGFQTLRVTIAEQLDAPDWLAGKGNAVDDDGNLAPYECENENPIRNTGASEGDTVVLENVKVEDRKAGMTLVCSAVTQARATVDPDGDQSGLPAAADGGHPDDPDDDDDKSEGETDDDDDDLDAGVPDDAEGAKADARRLAKLLSDTGKTKSRVEIVQLATDRVDVSPDRAEQLLDYAVSKLGIITEHGDDGYSASYP